MDKPGPGHLYWMILELTPNIPKGVALISMLVSVSAGFGFGEAAGISM